MMRELGLTISHIARATQNAANEVAVAAFLDKRIRFDQIHHLNLATMESLIPPAPVDLEDLLELDQRSRSVAQQIALKLN